MSDRRLDNIARIGALLDRPALPADGACEVAGRVHRTNPESPEAAPEAAAV